MKTIAKTLAIATLGFVGVTGAFAADQLNANNNRATQTNSGARAEQKIKIGFLDGKLFGSARVNANNNRVTQSNSGARAKQEVEIGVYK